MASNKTSTGYASKREAEQQAGAKKRTGALVKVDGVEVRLPRIHGKGTVTGAAIKAATEAVIAADKKTSAGSQRWRKLLTK